VRRKILLVGAPLIAVLTFMLGLRVGAGEAVRAATIYATPPGRPATAKAPTPVTFQIFTFYEERSVRESIALSALTLVARWKGHEAAWKGSSNTDGIAEANLELADFAPEDDLYVELLAEGEKQPLAAGHVSYAPAKDQTWGRPAENEGRAAARPTKREGDIRMDVLVEGGRLVTGYPTTMWIRAPGATLLHLAPEPGLTTKETALPCEGTSWFAVDATAQVHVVGIGIDALDKELKKKGEWFGALPVAPGAFFVGMVELVFENQEEPVVVIAPNPRPFAYVEVDDELGRVWAAVLDVRKDDQDGVPRAKFEIPPLAKGLHWLVVSGEPKGAVSLAGAAYAKPFLVGPATPVCEVGPFLARHPAEGFPRWEALDGMAVRGAANRGRHRLGLIIGLVSLFAAALLDILILIALAREARAITLLAELEDEGASGKPLTAKPPGGSLAVAVLLCVLGFALLAVVLIVKG